VIGEVASAMAIDKPFKCPLNLEPPSTSQEGVRQMKEHVAVDHLCQTPDRRSRTHIAVRPLALAERPRDPPSPGPLSFSAHQMPAQSLPPMSNDPTLKPTASAYW
jgi:hypothetical protein